MPPDSFTTWEEISRAFLEKYFPPIKTKKIKDEINQFVQKDGETLYDAWERMKDLQRKCPHHGIPQDDIIENFFNGLDRPTRSAVNSAAGGRFMRLTDEEALELLDDLALYDSQYGDIRVPSRCGSVYETESINSLHAKLDQILLRDKR